MFREILIPTVVSKSTKYLFLSVKGIPFSCTAVHLYYKIHYSCLERLFYVSVVAAIADA